MRAIAIAKSPLQDAGRSQRTRLLTTTTMRTLLAPSILQTSLLVGWKGQRITARADTLNFCILTPSTIWVQFNHLHCIFHDSRARFFVFSLIFTSILFTTLQTNNQGRQHRRKTLNCHTGCSSRRCIPRGRIFNTPHSSAQNSNDGLFLLVPIQLPHIIENQTHKTKHKNMSSSFTINLNFAPALLFSRSVHPLLRPA